VQDIAAAVTGQTSGRNFNLFMGACYARPTYLGEFAEIAPPVRSYAAKCWRERDAIAKWRQKIGQDRAMRLNHPQVVWQAFEASRRPASAATAPVASPYEATKQKLAEALAEIDRLRQQQPAPATSKDQKAMEHLQARLKMAEAMREAADKRFSEVAAEAAKLKREVETLSKDGPPWMKSQLASQKQDNAQLRREVAELTALAKLPADQHKRYLASCRRWRAKKQVELNARRRSLEERERTVSERTGAIPVKLWRDLMLCLHPDGRKSTSDKVLARTFDEMRQRESVLRRS
jgi:hypothetical protein